MNNRSVFTLVRAIFLTIFLGFFLQTTKAQTVNGGLVNSLFLPAKFSSVGDDAARVYRLINDERRKKGLTALAWDASLAKVAQSYSRLMAREDFFSHFDQKGHSVGDRVKSAKISGWSKIGENLFYCRGLEDFADFSVRGWMKSSGHRQNILDKSWTQTGIGVAEADGEFYITQIFMRR